MSIIVIIGKRGCGKTTHAKQLAKHFGCTGIVDGLDSPADSKKIKDGDLVLCTYLPTKSLPNGIKARVISYREAIREAGIACNHQWDSFIEGNSRAKIIGYRCDYCGDKLIQGQWLARIRLFFHKLFHI